MEGSQNAATSLQDEFHLLVFVFYYNPLPYCIKVCLTL